MEGSESGALGPSDTFMEAEIWVKLSNFPAEFLTSLAISKIVSSFGSPVMTDEETYEKLENHKWPPKLRRKLHSRITFVRALVRVRVTAPLPSCMAVFCPKGRKYIIGLDFDPIPKLCLLCSCAGHFDFECCGTDKVSVEIIDEAGEGCLDVNARCADCSDGFRADFNGEQGAALMVDSPAASCDIGAAAAPELMPLLPATDHGVQGTLISEGSGSFEDPPVLVVDPLFLPPAPGIVGDAATDLHPEGTVFTQGSVSCEGFPVLEVDPPFLPPAPCTFGAAVSVLQPEVGELAAVHTTSDGLDVTSTVEKVAAVLEVDPLLPRCNIGTTIFQANSPTKHHKWRDKSVVLGLFEKLDLLMMLSRLSAVTIDWAVCYGDPPDFEAALGEDFHNFEQGFCVEKSSTTHHKWRDKSEMQGLFCISFDELILLKTFLAATFLDLLIFKIQHKWRDKGMLI